MKAIVKYLEKRLGVSLMPELQTEWRRAAELLDYEANACREFSLYSRKCAQAACLRKCADDLDAAIEGLE